VSGRLGRVGRARTRGTTAVADSGAGKRPSITRFGGLRGRFHAWNLEGRLVSEFTT
jgi:hypothetical protein